jgi:hypothetical protein
MNDSSCVETNAGHCLRESHVFCEQIGYDFCECSGDLSDKGFFICRSGETPNYRYPKGEVNSVLDDKTVLVDPICLKTNFRRCSKWSEHFCIQGLRESDCNCMQPEGWIKCDMVKYVLMDMNDSKNVEEYFLDEDSLIDTSCMKLRGVCSRMGDKYCIHTKGMSDCTCSPDGTIFCSDNHHGNANIKWTVETSTMDSNINKFDESTLTDYLCIHSNGRRCSGDGERYCLRQGYTDCDCTGSTIFCNDDFYKK